MTDEQSYYRKLHSETLTGLNLFFQSYNAKISDFGLAKMGPTASQSHVTTRVMGTYGYAAPEYVATGNITRSLKLLICDGSVVLTELKC